MTDVVLAGGCFWCLDAVYRQFHGVEASVCGYTGGDTPDPDYRSVCSGATGHQEALKLSFDPQVIDLDTVRSTVRCFSTRMSSSVRHLSVRWRVLSSCTPPPLSRKLSPWACSMRLRSIIRIITR